MITEFLSYPILRIYYSSCEFGSVDYFYYSYGNFKTRIGHLTTSSQNVTLDGIIVLICIFECVITTKQLLETIFHSKNVFC